ncbi:MAG: hypothetical protein JO295_10030 [Verrucomicrobia bacterium]|nr:hypothetical protein [Verrucomicrobiota bacterium]
MKTRALLATAAATSLMFALAPVRLTAAPPPVHLEFSIESATNPGGASGGYTGRVTFDRPNPDGPYAVTWKLNNGVQTGWAVHFAGSDYIAVGYGKDLGAVAIYKQRADGGSDAFFSYAVPKSQVTSYSILPTKEPGEFRFSGGMSGSMVATPAGERCFDLEWRLPSGTWKGLGVSDGDFLAAASSGTGGDDVGVVLYKKIGDGAQGWWRITGRKGFGTENLKIENAR